MPNPKVGPPVPPVVLSQVPKTLVRELEVSEVLRDALIATKHSATYGPVIAFMTLESYHDAARREQRRMTRARTADWKCAKPRRGSLFADIHFYLIIWSRIAKLARFIANQTQFRRTGLVLRRYDAELKEKIDARDHLEHFEERLPGGSRQWKLEVPNDLLNMTNDFLTYGGRKLDVGPTSLRLLTTIINEFRTALLFDSVEALASADPNRLLVLLKKAASSVHRAQVTRRVEKLLKPTR